MKLRRPTCPGRDIVPNDRQTRREKVIGETANGFCNLRERQQEFDAVNC